MSSTPAKIIDPDTGASTWAFGSHRWVINIGNFTMKAVIIKSHQIFDMGLCQLGFIGVDMERELLDEYRESSLISRGKDAVMVYMMRYRPA